MSVAGDYIGRVRLGVTIGVAGSQSFVWPDGRPAGTYTGDAGADGAIGLTVTEAGDDTITVAWAADASRRMIGHPWRLLRDGAWLFGDLYVFEAEPTDQDPAEYTVIDGTVEVRVAMVGGGEGGAQLDAENEWTALQTFYSQLPHTPLAEIGSTEPTVMIVSDDEHGELASLFGAAIEFAGTIIVSSGMRVTERDATGVPTGRYSYAIYNSLDGAWANLIAEGPTIQDIATAAKLPHVVGTPTQNDHAASKSYVDAIVAAINAADVAFTEDTGLLSGSTIVSAALRNLEGILDRSSAVHAISTTNVDLSLYVGQVVASQPTLSFDTVPESDGVFALIGQSDPDENGIYTLAENGGWVQQRYPNVLVGPQYRLVLNDPSSPADGRRWFYLATDPTFWQRGNGNSDAFGEVDEEHSTEEQTVYKPLPGRWVSYESAGGGVALGETSTTAYRGDRGKTAYDHSQVTGNPHGTTAADVGAAEVATEVWVGPAELTGAFGSLSSSDGSASRPAAWLIPDATTSLLGTDLRAHVPAEWAAMDVYLRAYQPSAVSPTGKVFEGHLEYGAIGVGDTVPTTGNWLNSDLLLHTPGAQNVMTEHLLSVGIPVVQGAYQQPIRLNFGRNSPTDTFDTGTLGILGLRLVRNDGSADPTAVTAAAGFRAKVAAGASDVDLAVIGDSTGDATTEWVYRLGQRLAARHRTHSVRYRLWNTTTHAWSGWTTVQTGTGARTISIHNMSMAGWSEVHWATELPAAAAGVTPDLAFVSLGHNSTTGSSFTTTYGAFVAQVAAGWPAAALVLIAQNPGTVTPADQNDRRTRIIAVATGGGWGWVDVFTLFGGLSPITSPQTYYSDTVHPGPIGSSRWAGRVFAALDGA